MHKPESMFENETHQIFCEFKIQTDPLNLTKRLELKSIDKNQKDKQIPISYKGAEKTVEH